MVAEPAPAEPFSLPTSEEDLCMRGNDDDLSSVISEFDYGQAPPTTYNTRVRTASTEDIVPDPNTELMHLIEELNEYAKIRNTHTRIKQARLAEILPDLGNAEHRVHSPLSVPANITGETQEVIRQHEMTMAELLRVFGAQDEATMDAKMAGNARKLIAELTNHWGAVGTAVGLAVHPNTIRPLP